VKTRKTRFIAPTSVVAYAFWQQHTQITSSGAKAQKNKVKAI